MIKHIKCIVEQENCKDGINLFEQRIANNEVFFNSFEIYNEGDLNTGIRDLENDLRVSSKDT